jgi:hypothetical protein
MDWKRIAAAAAAEQEEPAAATATSAVEPLATASASDFEASTWAAEASQDSAALLETDSAAKHLALPRDWLGRGELGTKIWWKHSPWRRTLESKSLLETKALILVGELLRVLLSHPSPTTTTSLPPPSSSSPVCHLYLAFNLLKLRLI